MRVFVQHLLQAVEDEALVWGAPAGFWGVLLIPRVSGGGGTAPELQGISDLSLGHLLMGWQGWNHSGCSDLCALSLLQLLPWPVCDPPTWPRGDTRAGPVPWALPCSRLCAGAKTPWMGRAMNLLSRKCSLLLSLKSAPHLSA